MNLRVLLLEPAEEDALFLQEVLAEIAAGRYWDQWVQIETFHESTCAGARQVLATESIHLILLNLKLEDSEGIETFLRIEEAAPLLPIILLTSFEETRLAAQLVRDGAQDFVIARQADCEPLAHAIRNAIERQRLVSTLRATTVMDPLTGLLNRASFVRFADRDRKLAERLNRRLMIIVAEPRNVPEVVATQGRQRRDLLIMEAADQLRNLLGPCDLLARIGDSQFALAIFDTEIETVEAAWARIHSAAATQRIVIGASIFDSDHPASLEALLAQATRDLAPHAFVMRR